MAKEQTAQNSTQNNNAHKTADKFSFTPEQQQQAEAVIKKNLEQVSKGIDTFSVFARDNLEAVMQSAGAATKTTEALFNELVAYSKQNVEDSVSVIKDLAAVRSPDAWMNIHTRFSQQYVEGQMAQLSKIGELFTAASREVAEPLNARLAALTELMSGKKVA